VIPYTESLKNLTTSDVDMAKIALRAKKEGMVTLRENAVKKMLGGKTTYQEVLRVTWEQS
jgi:general secretion pathway protein E